MTFILENSIADRFNIKLIIDAGKIERANHRWTWFIVSWCLHMCGQIRTCENLSMIDESWRIIGFKRDYDASTYARTFRSILYVRRASKKKFNTSRDDIINVSAPYVSAFILTYHAHHRALYRIFFIYCPTC